MRGTPGVRRNTSVPNNDWRVVILELLRLCCALQKGADDLRLETEAIVCFLGVTGDANFRAVD
jgi:hypothetical protein